jgi:hypothetical protein
LLLDFVRVEVDSPLHAQRGIAGAHRVVLVSDWGTEQGHDPIAHDLIERALVVMHGLHHPLEDGVQELPGLLRVPVGQQFHRALQIGRTGR